MIRFIFITVILFKLSNCFAEDLMSIYSLAKNNDPAIKSAKATSLASQEAVPQARANFLPTVNVTATTTGSRSTRESLKHYNTHEHKLNLNQSILNLSNVIAYSQAYNKANSANAAYNIKQQELILKTATSFFDILKAKDDLNFAIAEKKAFGKHLEQSRKRFEVGLVAKTDVLEAKSRYDTSSATTIEAEFNLQNTIENLERIVNKNIIIDHSLKTEINLKNPEPNNLNKWLETAHKNSLELIASRNDLEFAKKNMQIESTKNLPTIDITGSISRAKDIPNNSKKATLRSIGATLTIPILSGGNTISKTRENKYLYEASINNYDDLVRNIDNKIKQSFRNVKTKVIQTEAFKQAVISNKSALESTKTAFEIGTRSILDMLDAQSNLIDAQRQYTKAKYDHIIALLTLKATAGILDESSILEINSWLKKDK